MKITLVVFALVVLFVVSAFGQTDDSAKITTQYLGVLFTGAFQTTADYDLQNSAIVRGGVAGFVPLGYDTHLDFWAGMDFGLLASSMPIRRFSLSRTFSSMKAELGYMPRPMAVLFRPFPLSGDGLFELPATAVMPGKGTGIKLSWADFQGGAY